MKRIEVQVFTFATALAAVLTLPLSMHAQDAGTGFES